MSSVLHHHQLVRRTPVLGLIILLHAGFLYLIATAVKIQLPPVGLPLQMLDLPAVVEPERDRIDDRTSEVQEQYHSRARIEVKDPTIGITIDEELPPEEEFSGGIRTIIEEDPVIVTLPAVDTAHPIGQPNYPAQSVRMNQEGLVRVDVCVRPDGRLDRVTLGQSSGHRLLDEAAVKHMSRRDIRMKPGSRDGEAVTSCTSVPIRFNLNRR